MSALIKNLVKKGFYRKRKKTINVLTVFSFPIKVMLKLSLIGFLTSALRALISISLSLKMGPTGLFTHLKIILLQYFPFSVFWLKVETRTVCRF